MILRHVKEIARRWVMEKGRLQPGFQGAFFHGSVNWMSEDDILSDTSDVDIMIVSDNPPEMKLGKFSHRHILLEVSYLGWDQLQSAEQILLQYYMAGSFKGDSIISDPTGRLAELEAVISEEYPKAYWVQKRAEAALDKVVKGIENLNETAPLHDQVNTCTFSAGVMTHVLLVAGLENPTVVRRFAAAFDILASYDKLAFHDTLLDMLGCRKMSQARVEYHLVAMEEAFDRAAMLLETPYQFAADLTEDARAVAVGSCRRMIRQGYPREAMFWIAATYSRCQWVFAHDAPPEVQAQFNVGYYELLDDLGLRTFADRVARCEEIRAALPELWEVADAILTANPKIEFTPKSYKPSLVAGSW